MSTSRSSCSRPPPQSPPLAFRSLDTGRLNPETYELFESVEARYGLRIEYVVPERAALEDLVRRKGQFSFYRDGHKECCGVRKVAPLRRMLSGVHAWITGQRQDQSPGTRAAVPVVQADPTFGSSAPEGLPLIKFNPLAHMSGREVWGFLRAMDVPTNALHARGYVSIGCAPCTRAVLPGQHEREGRWWWEDAGAKECGLHSGNLSKAEAKGGEKAFQGKAGRETSREDREARLWARPDSMVRALSLEQVRDLAGDGPREEDLLLALYAPWCRFCQALEQPYEDLAAQLHRRGRKVAVAAWRADLDRKFANEQLGLETFPTILFFPKSVKGESRGAAKSRGVANRAGAWRRPTTGPPSPLLCLRAAGFVKYPSEKRDVESVSLWLDAVAGRAQH